MARRHHRQAFSRSWWLAGSTHVDSGTTGQWNVGAIPGGVRMNRRVERLPYFRRVEVAITRVGSGPTARWRAGVSTISVRRPRQVEHFHRSQLVRATHVGSGPTGRWSVGVPTTKVSQIRRIRSRNRGLSFPWCAHCAPELTKRQFSAITSHNKACMNRQARHFVCIFIASVVSIYCRR
jgi:hypothetical protein